MDDRHAESVDEDVAGTVGRRVTRNWLVAAVRVLLGQVLAGAVFLVLSHELAPSEYALYAVAAIVAPMAYSLVATPTALVLIRRAGSLDRGSVHAAFTGIVGYVIVGLVLVGVPTVLLSSVSPLLVVVSAAYMLMLTLAFPAYVVLQRNLQSARSSIVELLDRVAFQLMAAVCVVAGVTIERSVAFGLVAAGVCVVVVSQLFVPWRPRLTSPRRVSAELREAVHPFVVVGTSLLSEGALVPLLGVVASATAAGYYGWAYSILVVPTGFVHAATTALYPAFVRTEEDQLPTAVHVGNRIVTSMAVVLCAVVAATVPTLVGTLFPDRWEGGVHVVWILLAALACYAATAVANTYWNARRSLAQFARWQLAATVVLFACAVPAGAAWGAEGAALAYLVGRIVLATMLVLRMATDARLPVTGFFFASLAACAAASLGALGLASLVHDGWLRLAVATASSGVLGLAAMQLVTRGELRTDARTALALVRGRTATGGAPPSVPITP